MFDYKYPYTNFSELNLDWFLNKFKDLLEEQQQVSGKVVSLEETVQNFISFVNNYFDDLDVQQEINNKLNEMAEDGTLSDLIAPFVSADVSNSVADWLDEHVDPVGSAVIVDNTLTINGAAADAKATGDIAQNNVVTLSNLIPLIANRVATTAETSLTSHYYRDLRDGPLIYTLDPAKTYDLKITVASTGTYLIQAGSAPSVSSMIDTIYNGTLVKGENYIEGYTPTGAYTVVRSNVNEVWDCELYTKFSETLTETVGNNTQNLTKTVKMLNVNTSDFDTIYSKTIGNLPTNTIVNITPSHDAIDFPLGISGYYTIITEGDSSSPIQIAVDINSKMYRRKKTTSGWRDWLDEALDYSNIVLSGSTPQYTDFNDFPIGSIITVSALKLTNSPEGYGNTGHDNMDTGNITATVLTFSTYPNDPFLKSQICVDYRQAVSGNPKVSFRSAMRINNAYTWSKWTSFSQDGVIHATNKIVDINHLDYTFSDFNNAPINTVYQVDFNVADSVLNNPAPGKSGSLMTWGFSNSSRHALTQFYITHEITDACMYFRYGFEVSGSVYDWTPWQKVNTTTVD